MIICGTVVMSLGVLLIVFLKWVDSFGVREVTGIVMFVSLVGFLFFIMPLVWWGTYIWLDKVMNGISSRMLGRDRKSGRRDS